MTYVLLIFLISCISKFKFAGPEHFHKDYMSKKQTTTINGIFVFMVFLSHGVQYISMEGAANLLYVQLRHFLGQAVVTTFLFYSGYGMMQSIQKKKINYVKEMPIKAFKLLLQFDIAVCFYILSNLYMGRMYTPDRLLLAFTTWVSIGNSNWYITSMIILCLIIGLAFIISKDNYLLGLILTSLLTIGVVYFLMTINRPAYTYNTMICLPAGMIFSYIQPRFDKLIKNDLIFFIFLLLLFIPMSYSRLQIDSGIEYYSIWSILFAFSFVLFSKKIQIDHSFIEWLGKHIFSIYILQRIPMNVLRFWGLTNHPVIFMILSFLVTLIIAILFDKYIMPVVETIAIKLKRVLIH